MAARLLEYKPSAPRPFDEVKEEIRKQLVRQEAGELAQKAGREKLALLEQGRSERDAGLAFAKAVTVARNRAQPGFSPEAITRIFQADPAKLPSYVGAASAGGFSIYKVDGVINPPEPEPARLASARKAISDARSREIFEAYIADLKGKAKVEINQANLDKK